MYQNIELERQVLSFIIQSGKIPDDLNVVDFSDKNNCYIFETLKTLENRQSVINILTIVEFFNPSDRDAVAQLLEALPKPVDNIEGAVVHLRFLGEKRRLRGVLDKASKFLDDPNKSASDILTDFDVGLTKINIRGSILSRIISPEQYEDYRLQQLEKKKELRTQFIGTGFDELDGDLADGFRPGQISVIAGEPSMGKSILMAECAIHIASNWDMYSSEVLVFSPEAGTEKFSDRIDVKLTGIAMKELSKIRRWQKDDARFQKLQEAIKIQSQWKLHRFDKRGLSSYDLIRVCKTYLSRFPNIKVVFIDTVNDLTDYVETESGTQNTELEKMLMFFEEKVEELGIHLCLVSQLRRRPQTGKRAGEWRPDPRSVRGSGAFEQKATTMIFVHRPFVDIGGEADNQINLWLVKNRDGVRMKYYTHEFIGGQFTIGPCITTGF